MSTIKTHPEICKAILERRNRMSHVIIPGDINAEIGADGVSEALRQRWLVPDTESGYLCASNDLEVVAKMRKLAEMKPEQFKTQELPVAESHDLSILHTKRKHTITEIAAPGTGAPAPGLSTLSAPTPPQPHQPPPPVPAQPPAAGAAGGGPAVGNPVTVARQGISAQGVIEKMLPDGRFQVGYGPEVQHRPPGDNVFSKDEVTMVPNAPQRT